MRTTPLAIALLLAALAASPAMAADSGQIQAEVTPAAPCVTVGSNVDYGTLPFSTSTAVGSRSGSTSYTNCSVQAEQIFARGTSATSATSGATWNLTGASPCAVGPNVYAHSFGDASKGLNLRSTDQLFDSSAAAGATRAITTILNMPCSGSAGTGEKMTFSIVITASF